VKLGYLEIRTADITLGGETFTVSELSGRDLFRYLARLGEIREDGANLVPCLDGILLWLLRVDSTWLAHLDLEEKLAVLVCLKTLNDLDDSRGGSGESGGRQVTWDEACDVVGARYGMTPMEVWATFPIRLIRRFYFHALRAVERDRWFLRRLQGDTQSEPRWLHGDPDEQDERKQLASEDWRTIKERHQALRGRPRQPMDSRPLSI